MLLQCFSATLDWMCLNRENIKPLQRRKHDTVFLTTTIRRIESGFNNFYYQCPPLPFTSRSRPIYIYIIESLVHVTYVIVRHYSPSFSQKLFCYLMDINIVTNIYKHKC